MDLWDMFEPVDVIAKLPSNFVNDVESKKWQERRDALQALLTLCTENPKLCPKANYGEHIGILKKVLEKDANINVCALAAKCITAIATGLRKKFASYATLVAPVIFEKFKEKRPLLKDPLCECIDAVTATTTLEALGDTIQLALEKQNPSIKVQTCLFLYREFTKCNAQNAPKKLLKMFIPIFIKHTGDSDPDVREAAYSALGAAMKAIGEKTCMVLLTEISEDKTKMAKILAARDRSVNEAAEAETLRREKESVTSGPSVSGTVKNSAAFQSSVVETPIEVDTWEMLEPVDILSKLPATFVEGVESKKWQERRDALQTLLTLCNENPRLCPKANYGEHIAILKKILEKDANINVCALAARCLTAFAAGLRKKFSPYVSLVVPVIFEKFKEKRPLLRDPLCECIDAVVASTTLEAMSEEVQGALEKANPNIKIQTNLFLYRVFMKFNAQTMPKKILKALVPVIIKHTGDSDPEVREASYSALGAAMKAIGEKACMVLLSPIVEDKTKMAKIRDFRDKAAKEAGSDVVSAMVQSIHKSDHDEPEIDERVLETKKQSPLKPPATVGLGSKKTSKGKIQETDNASANSPPKESLQEESNMEENIPAKESPLVTNREKTTRLKDEKNFKVLKWNFDQPTTEHVEQLHLQFTSVAIPSLCSMLFSKDFKQHLKALDVLDSLIIEDSDAVVANSDLILKWISLRFFETNQQVLLKALDLASKVLSAVQASCEPFTDTELTSFVPYLVTKLGETKDSVRGPVRKILFLLVEIASPPRIFPFVVDGLSIKNSRLRAECLQILLAIIDSNGLGGTSTPGPSLKAIATCISDRDSNVRNGALNAIVAAYKEAGDVVFQLIGKLNDKDQAMLEERIKRSGVVPKKKGSPNINSSVAGRKSRPVIGSAVKGGKMTPRKRSVSRHSNSGFNPSAEDESFDEKSPVVEETKNRTFSVDKQDGDTTIGSSRPRFSLNLKALGIDPTPPACPQLRDDEEINSLLNQLDAPVQRRTQTSLQPRRAESICSITSLDSYAAADIDKAIHGIASISPSSAVQALSQLQYLFQEPGLFRFLAERIDAVIQAVVTQTSLIRSRHLSDFSLLDEVNDLIRLINNFLCSMVREHTTCRRITTENLKMLIQEFLYLLKDERLKRLKGVSEIVRSLNYLTIRICDNADPTFCYLALISMLASALRDPQNDTVVLIIKCIIKQSDQFLRDNFAKETPMDMDSVMLAIHEFMKEFKSRADESNTLKEATRCVETSIQRLTVAHGASILSHFSLVSDPENSEAVDYTQRCVRSWQKNRSGLANSTFGSLPGQVAGASGDSLRHVVNGVIQDPFGKGLKDLLACVKNVPSAKDSVDEMLKENIQHKEFVQYHMKKAMDGDRDSPNLLPQTKKAVDFLRSMEMSLKGFLQTGVWNENNDVAIDVKSDRAEVSSSTNRRMGQTTNVVSGDELPESEDSSVASRNTSGPHKQTLTASDVEPLRQLLIRRRGIRD